MQVLLCWPFEGVLSSGWIDASYLKVRQDHRIALFNVFILSEDSIIGPPAVAT